jgi:hypothetical protein
LLPPVAVGAIGAYACPVEGKPDTLEKLPPVGIDASGPNCPGVWTGEACPGAGVPPDTGAKLELDTLAKLPPVGIGASGSNCACVCTGDAWPDATGPVPPDDTASDIDACVDGRAGCGFVGAGAGAGTGMALMWRLTAVTSAPHAVGKFHDAEPSPYTA